MLGLPQQMTNDAAADYPSRTLISQTSPTRSLLVSPIMQPQSCVPSTTVSWFTKLPYSHIISALPNLSIAVMGALTARLSALSLPQSLACPGQ